MAVTTLPDRQTRFFPTTELVEMVAYITAAAGQNLYSMVCTIGPRPARGRGSAADAVALPGVVLDIDVGGPAHADVAGRLPLPADYHEALALVDEMPLPPTAIYDTGHGLLVRYLFTAPLVFTAAGPRAAAADLSARWNTLAVDLGRAHGWHVDNVGDLARLTRVAGTWNSKAEPVPVRVVERHPGRRYRPEELAEALPPRPAPTPPPAPAQTPIRAPHLDRQETPAEAFSRLVTWDEILTPAGFTPLGDTGYWRHWAATSPAGTPSASTDVKAPGNGPIQRVGRRRHRATGRARPPPDQVSVLVDPQLRRLRVGRRPSATGHEPERIVSAAAPLSNGTAAAIGEALRPPATNGKAPSFSAWPELAEAGWHGPAGAFAREADPHTEADPVGVLVSTLAIAGAMIGRGPHFQLGNERHGANIWPVVVGDTAARKGTALAVGRSAMAHAEPTFTGPARDGGRWLGGWGSGEALIDALADGTDEAPGTDDKRMLVVEREYARLLKVAQRDNSTLSPTLRDAWDGQPLESRTRGSGTKVATGHHVGLIAHITADELRSCLSTTETLNGWANRFLWLVVRRRGRLPEGGNVPEEITARYGQQIGDAIARTRTHGRMVRTPAARDRWAAVYADLGDDEPPGMLGAIVGRAEPQCARLSLLYALLDGAAAVDTVHVEAGYALWRFCRASAERVWGETIGDPLADKLLVALRSATRLDGTGQHQALGRHVKASDLDRARKLLVSAGLATVTTDNDTGGRPRDVLLLCEKSESSESSNPGHPAHPITSHYSLDSHPSDTEPAAPDLDEPEPWEKVQ